MDEIPQLENVSQNGSTGRLDAWLAALVARAGSDLLLISGAAPCIRNEGVVQHIEDTPLNGPEIEAAVLPCLPPHAQKTYREAQIADSSYAIDGLGRFRVNLHRERGRAAATIRALPTKVPSLSELNLPAAVASLARLPRGLVLISGPAGSGK